MLIFVFCEISGFFLASILFFIKQVDSFQMLCNRKFNKRFKKYATLKKSKSIRMLFFNVAPIIPEKKNR